MAAIRAAEKSLWNIGDALIKDCGPPGVHGVNTGDLDKLERCAGKLRGLGFDTYSLDYLRELRGTAASFEDGDRSPSASWTVHSVAGDPATLRAATEAAARECSRLTADFVRTFKKRQRQGEEHAEDPQSAKTLAKRAFDKALADLLDLRVTPMEVMKLIYSRYVRAQRWREFVAAFQAYFLQKVA